MVKNQAMADALEGLVSDSSGYRMFNRDGSLYAS